VNILKGAISGKKGRGKTSTTILKANRQEHRSGQLYNNEKNGVQQIQMESCQPIKGLKEEVYLYAAGCSSSQKSIQIEENFEGGRIIALIICKGT